MFVILCCMAMTTTDSKQGATAATGVVDPDVVALSVTDSMINIDHQLHHVPAKTALELVEFCRRRLDATEARIWRTVMRRVPLIVMLRTCLLYTSPSPRDRG